MKSFAERLNEHLRLVVLRCLAEVPREEARRMWTLQILQQAPRYVANLSVLQDELAEHGHVVTRDQMQTMGDWLAEQDLCARVGDGAAPGLRLTQRGLEVAIGAVTAFGVASRPTVEWLHAQAELLCLEVSVTDVEKAVVWLEGAGLVVVTPKGFVIPLPRALDVASGRERVDGIKVPSLSSIMAGAARSARGLIG